MIAEADIVLRFSVEGSPMQTGFTVVCAPQKADHAEVADSIYEAWRDSLWKRQCQAYRLTVIEVTANGMTIPQFRNNTGKLSSKPVSPGVCALLAKVPIQGSPGRMYVPGIPDFTVENDGRFASGAYPAIQNDFQRLLSDLNNEGMDMVMRRPDGTLDLVTYLVVRPYVGRQDRRLVRSRR